MHTFTINTVSFRHVSALEGPSSRSMTDTFQQQDQPNELPDPKFSLVISVQYITRRLLQSCSDSPLFVKLNCWKRPAGMERRIIKFLSSSIVAFLSVFLSFFLSCPLLPLFHFLLPPLQQLTCPFFWQMTQIVTWGCPLCLHVTVAPWEHYMHIVNHDRHMYCIYIFVCLCVCVCV